tara:strand:- start:119 stop:235 length:117 start_codon:yes stop_codon:yes gene_type:complete
MEYFCMHVLQHSKSQKGQVAIAFVDTLSQQTQHSGILK